MSEIKQENGHSVDQVSEEQPAEASETKQSLEEADNIVQDALQLAENDELNEYRPASGTAADKSADTSDRNIWVSGLSQSDRASDLQSIFKKHGKVVGAKIITNTRIPGSRHYGLITMETKEQADKCIQSLNKTELNGKTITVEKNRPKESSGSGSSTAKDKSSTSKSHRDKDGDRDKNKPKDKSRDKKKSEGNNSSSASKNKDQKGKERGREKEKSSRKSKSPVRARDGKKSSPPRRNRSRSPFRGRGLAARGGRAPPPPRRPFVPRETRINPAELRRIEMERLERRRERMVREATDLRRLDEDRRQREFLQIEAEKLRRERELLDREKAELLKLERERARMEREKIEREKEEIQRKMNHERDFSRSRAAVGPAALPIKRPYESRDPDSYWESDRKRQLIPDTLASTTRMAFEPTSASRFEFDSRGAAPVVSQERFPVRGSGDYNLDSRRDNGRPDRDDRARALAATSAVSNPGFYRSDMRDARADVRRAPVASGRGDETSWKSESRRERPVPTVSSMISVSGSSIGPQGMYSATTGAPLSSMMTHSSLSSPIGAAQLDRPYVHSMRRFAS